MRYLCLVLLLFSFNSFSAVNRFRSDDAPGCAGATNRVVAQLKYLVKYAAGYNPPRFVVVDANEVKVSMGMCHGYLETHEQAACPEDQPNETELGCAPDDEPNPEPCLGGGIPVNGICPPIGPGDDDNPNPEPCLGGGIPVNGICPPIGPGDDDNPPTGGGDDDNPPTGGGDDDNPPTGGGGDDNPPTGGGDDDNPPTGGGGDDNPPTGGGGDDNPPTGGGGDDKPPTGGGGFPDFCRDNPDICLYPPDDPACYDNPALCDVPENGDLLATIRQVTEAVKDQHYNTNTVIKTNTLNTANNTNDLLSATEANHDQLNKISSNINSIANNTSDANALIKNNTAKIVGAIKDIEGNDYSGQLSAIKSELTQVGNELQKGFCDKNPNHESCVEKKADTSSCEKFVCTGEPVLCMLLEVEHQKKCFLPNFDGIGEGIDKIISESNPSQLIQSDVMDFSNPDDKYLNGGGVTLKGSCPSPVTVNVFGETVGFSYQPICDIARLLNPFVIAMAWIVAAISAGRGISNL